MSRCYNLVEITSSYAAYPMTAEPELMSVVRGNYRKFGLLSEAGRSTSTVTMPRHARRCAATKPMQREKPKRSDFPVHEHAATITLTAVTSM